MISDEIATFTGGMPLDKVVQQQRECDIREKLLRRRRYQKDEQHQQQSQIIYIYIFGTIRENSFAVNITYFLCLLIDIIIVPMNFADDPKYTQQNI